MEATINGPSAGRINTDYSFVATVTPLTTTWPITFTWQASDQEAVTHVVSDLKDTVVFSWDVTGYKTITVTASNRTGTVVTACVVSVFATGYLDPSFGNGGIVTTTEIVGRTGSSDQVRALVIQPDNKIVAAGPVQVSDVSLSGLARYNSNGTLDTTFGAGGIMTTPLSSLTSLVLQPDGKFVAAGCGNVFRYNPDGTLDETFGAGGTVTTTWGCAWDMAAYPDGRFIVGFGPVHYRYVLARYNPDGSLDSSFGPTGTAIIGASGVVTISGGFDFSTALAVQTDGKVVVAGYGSDSLYYDFMVTRFNSDGSLDTNFGSEGIVVTSVRNEDKVTGLIIQPDGKLVVAGYADSCSLFGDACEDFALVRYSSDGALDTSFGDGGIALTDFGSRADRARTLIIQTDGKLVAAGSYYDTSNRVTGLAMAYYNTDGSLDSGFGSGGKVATHIIDVAYALANHPDGKLVAAGSVDDGFNMDFALVRYDLTGSPDTSFGSNGKVVTNFIVADFGYGGGDAYALVIQPDGKLVVAGSTSSHKYFAVVRYNPDGTLDNSFGSKGRVITNFGAENTIAKALLIQPDGKLVAAGVSGYKFAAARYNPDGTLDQTFGAGGIITTSLGTGSSANAVAIQPDGKLVLAGSNLGRFALVRYNSDGSLDISFGAGGIVTNSFSSSDSANDLVIQADNKLLVAGRKLARYNPDGTLDTSFGVGGIVDVQRYAAALALQPDNKIVVSGGGGSNSPYWLKRYNSDGTLDSSFGNGGQADFYLHSGGWGAVDMVMQPDGKFVMIGEIWKAYREFFALVRCNSNGTLDTSFGAGGVEITAIGSDDVNPYALIIQPDGKLVAIGESDMGYTHVGFTLARYLNDAVVPAPSGMHISGPWRGDVEVGHTFAAAVISVVGVDLSPLTYIWEATGQTAPRMHTDGGLTDAITFSWPIAGRYAITVTAFNPGGLVMNTHAISVGSGWQYVYLPLALKNSK